MRIQRFSGFIGLAGVVWLVGAMETQGQAPPEAEVASFADDPDDAAARALRSLYVPKGLTAERAVEEVLRTSPDVQRTRALSLEAKGGAVQAMSGLVPRLELTARATKLSPVETAGLTEDDELINDLIGMVGDPPAQMLWRGLFDFQFPSLTTQYATDATFIYSFTGSPSEALPAYRAA